ncbi:MAG: AraC family transcriptional regulator [Chromatiaceae bacterium]|nr:AraC family transcriptional regulator [Chromatiaceae bacterium]
MRQNTYKWLCDRETRNRDRSDDLVEIRRQGLVLKLERLAFDDYAAVDIGYVATEQPFTVTPRDTSHGRSERVMNFLVVLSGRAEGRLADGRYFILDKDWGVLSDFYGGTITVDVHPGEPLRSFGAALPIRQAVQVFKDEDNSTAIEDFVKKRNFLRSFRMTPATIQIVNNAANCSLTGALRRLFLEGAALQLFALIFAQDSVNPVTGDKAVTSVVAHKKAVMEAADLLLADLENPPSLVTLASQVGLSARKLNAGSRELYGCTLFELLARHRLEVAKCALEADPSLPIKIVASKVGYSHDSNFIAAFKKQFGLTPSQHAKIFTR